MDSSEESGRVVLKEYLKTCELTGATAVVDEIGTSELSGKQALKRLFQKSEISSLKGLADDFMQCEFTEVLLRKDECVESQVSSKLMRMDQQRTCGISGKVGHASEFKGCEFSNTYVLPSYLKKSTVSGLDFRTDQQVTSEKNPQSIGHETEAATCAKTGRTLLVSEVGLCQETDETVDLDLLVETDSGPIVQRDLTERCGVTLKHDLPRLMGNSAVSGKRVLRSILRRCSVSYQLALREEMDTCSYTDEYVVPKHLEKSDVTGDLFRSDERTVSKKSKRVGHRSESVACHISGNRLLVDETITSEVSNQKADKSFQVKSEESGRIGITGEEVVCAVRKIVVLEDEVDECAVTHQVVCLDLLFPCEFTLAGCLLDQLKTSDLSEKKYRANQEFISSISGRCGHISEGCTISFGNRQSALKDEAAKSELSGDWFLIDDVVQSQKSGRIGHKTETVQCEESGVVCLKDEVGRCSVTGKDVNLDLMKIPFYGSVPALSSELFECETTGKTAYPRDIRTCSASGKRVHKSQVFESELSDRIALKQYREPCHKTGTIALRDELAKCEKSARRYCPNLMRHCHLTGTYAFQSYFVDDVVAKKPLLLEKAVASEIFSGRYSTRNNLIICTWSGKSGFIDEFQKCRLTGLKVAKSFLNEEGELSVLRQVLNPADPPGTHNSFYAYAVRQYVPGLCQKPWNVLAYISPNKQLTLVRFKAKRKWWHFKLYVYAGIMSSDTMPVFVSLIVRGENHGGHWELIQTLEWK
jgi:hypothetical protein